MPKAKTASKPKVRRKNGIIKYKFQPPSPEKIAAIAQSTEKVQRIIREREVIRQVAKGYSYEEVAEELGISPKEAYDMTKSILNKYITETGLSLLEAKELDLKRYDGLLAMLMEEAQPREGLDKEGNRIMLPPSLDAVRLIITILDKRADILGYGAAKKMEVKAEHEHIHRLYTGADPDAL